MIKKINTLFLFATLLLTIPSQAQSLNSITKLVSKAPAVNQPENQKLIALPTPESDTQTIRIINTLLKQAELQDQLNASIIDGVVTVEGQAEKKTQLEWFMNTTQDLPGVLAVLNKTKQPVQSLTDWSPAANEMKRMFASFQKALPNLLSALLLIALFYFLNRYIRSGIYFIWKTKISNPFLLDTISKLSLLPLWIFFFYLTLKMAGLSTLATTIIGGTGMLGLVLGLAFRGIAENYLAGILLAMRSPFTKGDLIEIGDHLGYVQNLNMRGTTIIDLDGNLVLIPNSTVIQSIVQNRSANPLTRTEFTVGIAYSDSISAAQDLILKTLPQVRGVLSDPEISVLADTLGSASVTLKVLFWFNIKDSNQNRVRSRAIIFIKETLLSNGFTIPDDAREIIFADTLKVQMLESKEDVKLHEEDRKNKIIDKASVNLEEKINKIEPNETAQEKDLMRLADENPLLMERPKGNLLKP